MTAVATPGPRRETSRSGMAHLTCGSGPKSLLFIQGGPGSVLPTGLTRRLMQRLVAPYVRAGYTVSIVTRRRHMPPGHTPAGMAEDYAQVIDEQCGGHADVVVDESDGGMIAQYLAALHPDRVGQVALVVSGPRPAAGQPGEPGSHRPREGTGDVAG